MNNLSVFTGKKGQNQTLRTKNTTKKDKQYSAQENNLPEILFITSYPPRECGIATYSQDLLKALANKFSHSFSLKVCALESGKSNYIYPEEVKYVLDTNQAANYYKLTRAINKDERIKLLMIQHEFGLFDENGEDNFLQFLYSVVPPIALVFHTVLPQPDAPLKAKVRNIAAACASLIVLTKSSAAILNKIYGVPEEKIVIIEHGTHLVPYVEKVELKEKYGLTDRKVLTTFGLLGPGKSIETTLKALPYIIESNQDVIFLVIGKTHSGAIKNEGERYRNMLEQKVEELNLQEHVKFINRYLPLQDLLEYLQLTDIYVFTSKDPNQAVSGTFSYAMSCGCPIISTPIPHAKEVLTEKTGILIDFQNAEQLADAVNGLLSDEFLLNTLQINSMERMISTVWENSALKHALLLRDIVEQNSMVEKMPLQYHMPPLNLNHIKKMTTDIGMIQFSIINQPDLSSGYTLDDNARALIALCMHYEQTADKDDLKYIRTYLDFIKFCQKPEGDFLNYVDASQQFTQQNYETNLSDSNGRAIWALGYLMSKSAILPKELAVIASDVLQKALPNLENIYSPRTIAFVIKGLYYDNVVRKSAENRKLIRLLADRLMKIFWHVSEPNWLWFENYMTYGNSILPEAMLFAYLETGNSTYKDIAKSSFDFLLTLTFNERCIKVISNKTWLHKGECTAEFGEQPIDVAYTILSLSKFYTVFKEKEYTDKMERAFNWFLGNNHLNQIIYNPCTGGCFDGLEEKHVNLNQGAESTVCYLMARLTVEKYLNREREFVQTISENIPLSAPFKKFD